jgi:hypothetical protein
MDLVTLLVYALIGLWLLAVIAAVVRVSRARRWLELEGKEVTEALCQAMLHNEIVFNRMIGGRARDKATENRREMP